MVLVAGVIVAKESIEPKPLPKLERAVLVVQEQAVAFAHTYFNDQLPHGRMLRRVLNMAEESDDLMADVRDVMIQMRDGDGSQDAHYAEVTARFGFTSDAKAKAAFLELDSAYSKTSGNGSVTDVRAARDQLFAKLRG